jgi:Zn-dependent M28 family amino/carboxypeptidase
MLELAEKLTYLKGSHKRSILFIAFSGEEMGLLGSKYFADNPGIELSKVNAMINLDMVGRLQESGVLQITGAGTAEGLKEILNTNPDTTSLKLKLSDEGYGPSDHSSFYGKNIPVLFFTTGAHLDYHTPADTWDKINYEGIVTISDYVYNTVLTLATSPERLKFRESGPKPEPGRVMRRKGVTLGIMPDFAGNVKNGLRADFVTPGKPAAIGGMKKGDIITAINGKSVNNIQDYMYRMSQLKHGQTINVEVLREEKKLILLIQL